MGQEIDRFFMTEESVDTDAKADRVPTHGSSRAILRADRKVIRLIRAFLKAGVLAEDQFIRTDAGTSQGVLSPLLANIALEVIEERYARWVYRAKDKGQYAAKLARMCHKREGKPVFFPIRYADDFVILVSGAYNDAVREKEALAAYFAKSVSCGKRAFIDFLDGSLRCGCVKK